MTGGGSKTETAHGIYVNADCCTSCGVPWDIAPEIFSEGSTACIVRRQPKTATEMRKVLRVLQTQDLDCIRYRGDDSRVVALLSRAGLSGVCDRKRVTTVKIPASLRAILGLSAFIAIAGVVSPLASGVGDSTRLIGTATAAVSLFFCWMTLKLKTWAFRWLVVVLALNATDGLYAYLAHHDPRATILRPLFFAALVGALLSFRRWFARNAGRPTAA